jgi:hypothetical protein
VNLVTWRTGLTTNHPSTSLWTTIGVSLVVKVSQTLGSSTSRRFRWMSPVLEVLLRVTDARVIPFRSFKKMKQTHLVPRLPPWRNLIKSGVLAFWRARERKLSQKVVWIVPCVRKTLVRGSWWLVKCLSRISSLDHAAATTFSSESQLIMLSRLRMYRDKALICSDRS